MFFIYTLHGVKFLFCKCYTNDYHMVAALSKKKRRQLLPENSGVKVCCNLLQCHCHLFISNV